MSEETIHEAEETQSRNRISTFFRRLGRRLGRGEKAPINDEQTVAIDPPEEAELEVEIEQEGDELTLEIEMAWEGDEDDDIDLETNTSKANFERYEDNAGEIRWRLVHDNGNIIADSGEGYASKQKATQGLESVKENASGAAVADLSRDEEADTEGASSATFELFRDNEEKFRWRLVHDNGEIISDGGQGYSSKQKAKQGLRSVKTNATGAEVVDVEE